MNLISFVFKLDLGVYMRVLKDFNRAGVILKLDFPPKVQICIALCIQRSRGVEIVFFRDYFRGIFPDEGMNDGMALRELRNTYNKKR